MVTELYDALLAAGAPEDKARNAASAVASYDKELADLRGDLKPVEWMVAANLAITAAGFGILGRVLLVLFDKLP